MIDLHAEQRLYDATTQGEWSAYGTVLNFPSEPTREEAKAGASFCAHSHNAYPAMLAEIAKGREAREIIYDILVSWRFCCANGDKFYLSDRMVEDMRRIAEGGQQ